MPAADLPNLGEARAYLRAEGDEMIACYAPATDHPDDQHCIYGWAVRRLSRRRRFKSGRRLALPAARRETYDLAHYEVVCRADDDRERAAELAAAIVVVARRDARVCRDRWADWQAAVNDGRHTAAEAADHLAHWANFAAELDALADELALDYLTAAA